jgi:hypothetical protein
MNKPIILALCLLLSGAALAQEGWLVPFAAAYQPDVAGFNSLFSENELPEARSRQYGWGVELRSLVGGGFLVGPMFLRTWDDVENDDFQLRTDATAILGEVGLRIAPFDFLYIVPMVGAGGLTQNFNVRTRSPDMTLEELLRAPGQNATISSGMKLAGMAALELGLSVPTTSGRYGVALRAGYLWSPLTVDWHLSNGARVIGAPTRNVGGPFFSAGILLLPAAQTQTARTGY